MLSTEMSDSKRHTLAFVISSLRMGGAERVASLIANELSSQYRILLFIWNDKERFYPLNPNVEIRILATKKRGVLGNILRIFKLWRAFRAQKVDLSIGFIHQTNILTILASKIARIPCIATEHSIFNALESKFWRILRYLTYPLANCVTTLTQQDLKHYSFVKNVYVLPNPVEITPNPHALVENLNSFKPYILTAGRMIASKGFDELIDAFRIFSAQFPQYTLLLAGDGIQRKALEEQAKGLKCKFLGKIESLMPYYANAEFFALASHREALSNVLIESLLCGTPVVSYDCPYGPKEIIGCDSSIRNGILVEMNEKRVESLAAAFVKMAQNRKDYAKNTALAYERFSSKVVLEKWQQLILDCLNKTPNEK
ncbi:glycosyltransferase [Helicobacter rodentium]|uniref:glycosyltransferase n=1 Tax=Helicobacter rodentium TaxID=59617 RepID=UPI0023EFF5F6|nr:glycosyltransferase [Helicobacter rodentium]